MKQLRSRFVPAALALAALSVAACEQTPFTPGESASGGYTAIDPGPSAVEYTGAIRIGVVPNASSVRLAAEGAWELVEKASGDVVQTGTGGELTVTLVTAARPDTIWRLQVGCYSFSATARSLLAEWQTRATNLGYITWTEDVGTVCTRARLQNTSGSNAWGSRNTFRNQAIADGVAGTDSYWPTPPEIVTGGAVFRVTGGSEPVEVNGGAVLRSADDRVLINGEPYRGTGEVVINGNMTLAGVNSLPMEEYLYGVVPRELPPVPYGELEALKAQAVAARTYAMRGLGKRASNGYDLLPTTTDQVYGGLDAEHPLSSQAVDETAGIVATYNGALIEALYSSTSGGFTANNEEVYTSDPVPYLRGVPDAQRGNSFEHVPTLDVFKRHANARSLRAYKAGDFEADWSRYHRWTFEWTAEEITRSISAYAEEDVGTVHAINVLERGPSGRALSIEYVTDAGTFEDTKDGIRSSLKFVDEDGDLNSLLSTLFYIEPVVDRQTKEVTGFVAWGGGWGHGVGLSQTGAVEMGKRGWSYDEILKHYYQGIALESAY
ncbi:MAG TPA: SpoIID/LytB domain-containing protein [Longimicrobiales bacterium]|nr:SpoIID/LytB domain-containing protein [Longimicrobiales bacterium]